MSKKTNITDDALDNELEALLADAAVDDDANTNTNTDETPEVVAESKAHEDVDLEAIEAEATAAEIRDTAYAEQEAETSGDTASVTPIKTKRAPRVSRAAGARASAMLSSFIKDDELLKAAMLVEGDVESEEAVEELKTTVDSLAKKVGDKAVNLLRFQKKTEKLQTYTRLGLQFLVEEKQASSKTLTEHLVAKGYTIGTARSQANQLMALLPALKVADRSARTLALNEKSVIVQNFNACAAAAA